MAFWASSMTGGGVFTATFSGEAGEDSAWASIGPRSSRVLVSLAMLAGLRG